MMDITELSTFVLGFLIISVLLRLGSKLKSNKKTSNLPPGPWKLPLIGNIHQRFGELPYRAMSDLAKKYGPLMHLQLGEVSHLIVSSPEVAKQVMKTHDISFASRPDVIAAKILSYNSTNTVFAPYGEYWRQLRKICNLELLSTKRVHAFRSIRKEENSKLIRWIACNEVKSINLTEKVYALLYGSISRATFGKKSEDQEDFQNIIKEGMSLAAGLNIADIYPSVKLFHWISGVRPAVEGLHRRIDRILEKIVNDHRANTEAEYEKPDDLKDLLDVLLQHQAESAEFHLTTENIKAILLDIFIAGGETLAATIDWALSEMMRNPSILRRAQEEVRHAFGGEGLVDEGNFDDLKYMRAVIKETLRLHTPSPLLFPRQNSEKVNINGYDIPAKTTVLINAWAIHRDPTYWQEAECFKPERFLDSSIDYKGTNFEYIPFGAGRRMCPGMTFGLASIELPIALFLYHFDWELPGGMKCEDLDMTEKFGVSLRRKNDLYLIPTICNPLPLS